MCRLPAGKGAFRGETGPSLLASVLILGRSPLALGSRLFILPLSSRPLSMFRSWDVKEKKEMTGKLGFGQSTPSSNKQPEAQCLPSLLASSATLWPGSLLSLLGFLPQGYSKPPSCRWFFQAYPLESCPVSPSKLPPLSYSTGRQRPRARAGSMPLSLAGSSTWSTARQMPSAAAAGAAAWSHWKRPDLQLCLPSRGPWYIGSHLAGLGWGAAGLSKADVGQAWNP